MFAAERELTIALDAGWDDALDACRDALGALGWMLVSSQAGGRLEAHEDPSGLRCRTTPSHITIEIVAPAPDETVVKISGTAPGIGRVPARRLSKQLAALARRVRAVESPK